MNGAPTPARPAPAILQQRQSLLSSASFLLPPGLLQALQSAIVLAEVLHQLGVRHQDEMDRIRLPRTRVRLRVVDLHLEIQVSEVDSLEPLCRLQRVGVRVAVVIEPTALLPVSAALESSGIDDERVAFPATDGVAVPRRIGILG